MKRVYIIPGLGVDERLFGNLRLDDAELISVKWITPDRNEPLRAYALRLAQQLDRSKPFYLLGVSFGGMCALEIAKELKPVKTILISSAKRSSELPWYFKILRFIPAHLLFSDRIARQLALRNKKIFGIKSESEGVLFRDMLERAPENYFRRAINCIVHWQNKEVPAGLFHIHGTHDRVIPHRNIKNCTTVKDGTHFMILNSADEVSRIVNSLLKE